MEICLFDLDQTLAVTDDLKTIREAGKNNASEDYRAKLYSEFKNVPDRAIYSLNTLRSIRRAYPDMKLGVFTRSPKSYSNAILSWLYPGFSWDIVIANEDVDHTKPSGDGIDVAMTAFAVKDLTEVVLVGDSDQDIRAAYHAGCKVVLDMSSWAYKRSPDQWRAFEHMADAKIESPEELLQWFANQEKYLPDLENRLSEAYKPAKDPRFDRINYFFPAAVLDGAKPTQVYASGRLFSDYDSIKWRKQWHILTASIHANKDSSTFPKEWINTVRAFIALQYPLLTWTGRLAVTVIPHRPGREPRLESFLNQLKHSYEKQPAGKGMIEFLPNLLTYETGVVSSSREHLNQVDRFKNVRDHLKVTPSETLPRCDILVIDDVVTSGASLLYAKKYLEDAGSGKVTCFSIAKNISKVL